MGIFSFGMVINRFYSAIAFYATADASPENEISYHETDNLHPQLTIMKTYFQLSQQPLFHLKKSVK